MTLLRLLFLCIVIYIVYFGAEAAAPRRQENRLTRRDSAKRWCSIRNAKPMCPNRQPWRAKESIFAAKNARSAI